MLSHLKIGLFCSSKWYSQSGFQRRKFIHYLFIIKVKAEVNEGPTAKRLKPRARGRSYLIKKTTCHITIVLKNISLAEYEYRD